MYDSKKPCKFGSLEESIIIHVHNGLKMEKMVEALFNVVPPEKAPQLIKEYRAMLFPEDRYDYLNYIKRAREHFKKIRDVNLFIQPIGKRMR